MSLNLRIVEQPDRSYVLDFPISRFTRIEGVLTKEDVGWLLTLHKREIDGISWASVNQVNVTVLPQGEIDWGLVISKMGEWSS